MDLGIYRKLICAEILSYTMRWTYVHNNTKQTAKIQQTIVEVWIFDRLNSSWLVVHTPSILHRISVQLDFWLRSPKSTYRHIGPLLVMLLNSLNQILFPNVHVSMLSLDK